MAETFGWGKWFDADRLGGTPYIREELTHDPEAVAALVEAARQAERILFVRKTIDKASGSEVDALDALTAALTPFRGEGDDA